MCNTITYLHIGMPISFIIDMDCKSVSSHLDKIYCILKRVNDT